MAHILKEHGAALCALALLLAVLLPVPVLADPYPSDSKAVPVDATTVLISWKPNSHAEGYAIHRNNAGIIAELSPDEIQYLDTGLTPKTPYFYLVGSLVDGQHYWDVHGDTFVMPIDPVEDLTVVSWSVMHFPSHRQLLAIRLVWTGVENISRYNVCFKIGGSGEYQSTPVELVNEASILFQVPDQDTRYWFKVCAADSYYSPESGETVWFDGPFSPAACIDVPADGERSWILPADGIPSWMVTLAPWVLDHVLDPLCLIEPTLKPILPVQTKRILPFPVTTPAPVKNPPLTVPTSQLLPRPNP